MIYKILYIEDGGYLVVHPNDVFERREIWDQGLECNDIFLKFIF